METKDITQVKVYWLILNTFWRAEDWELVALSYSLEKLKEWYDEQLLEESERINWWSYSFKEDSILRNYNPWWINSADSIFWHWYFSQRIEEWVIRSDMYFVK